MSSSNESFNAIEFAAIGNSRTRSMIETALALQESPSSAMVLQYIGTMAVEDRKKCLNYCADMVSTVPRVGDEPGLREQCGIFVALHADAFPSLAQQRELSTEFPV